MIINLTLHTHDNVSEPLPDPCRSLVPFVLKSFLSVAVPHESDSFVTPHPTNFFINEGQVHVLLSLVKETTHVIILEGGTRCWVFRAQMCRNLNLKPSPSSFTLSRVPSA